MLFDPLVGGEVSDRIERHGRLTLADLSCVLSSDQRFPFIGSAHVERLGAVRIVVVVVYRFEIRRRFWIVHLVPGGSDFETQTEDGIALELVATLWIERLDANEKRTHDDLL